MDIHALHNFIGLLPLLKNICLLKNEGQYIITSVVRCLISRTVQTGGKGHDKN